MSRKVILKTALPPGDICTLTAAIESLHYTYPDEYLTDVRTCCNDLFLHNPWITPLQEADSEVLEMHYTDLIACCGQAPNSFLSGYCHDLGKKLSKPLVLTTNRPHLYLSDEEKFSHPLSRYVAGKPISYWLINAGVKKDLTLKQWPVEYFQEVVNYFREKIQFVQVGSNEHDHPVLDGVINLVGKTDIRSLLCIVYHAEGGIGPITFLQHLCAAFEKPYVAILGGREPVTWTQYPLQSTLHTLGKLQCCKTTACWKSRVTRLNDGCPQDDSLCQLPILTMQRPVGKCMAIIKPIEVTRAVEACYEGGAVNSYSRKPNSVVQDNLNTEKQDECLELVAHAAWGFDVEIIPASAKRHWMDATKDGFAYHCLPMVLANQSGWFILAPHDVIAEWNGGKEPSDLTLTIPQTSVSIQAQSNVGSGILTWTIPYVFRTPPGWNLLCRGPANYVKDGISPLEGLVETDWSFASFSMNWKCTRPGRNEFNAGEPIAMIVPQKRFDLEMFRPRFAELNDNPELARGYDIWIRSREAFWAAQQRRDPKVLREKYQKHYFRGCTNLGAFFPDHQKARELALFAKHRDVSVTTITTDTLNSIKIFDK